MDLLPRLPYAEEAYVQQRKLTGYLMDERWRGTPADKVGLVVDVLGFTDPEMLRSALLDHARRWPAQLQSRDVLGQIFNVTGPLVGPSGTVVGMVSCWMIGAGARRPRFITLMPARRTRGTMPPW